MTASKNKHSPAIVGIVPRKNLWSIIQSKKWYHIPVKSAPENAQLAEYIAFYFPAAFGEVLKFKVSYYAKVKKAEVVKRIALFPDDTGHEQAYSEYIKFHLGTVTTLPNPIPSRRWRRIVHIPTNLDKLFNAEEINDLYDTSPLEEKMYKAMKKNVITAERNYYINAGNNFYCLDFGIFCHRGNINVECDGAKYHSSPDALAKDRVRNNILTSLGWRVLRFSGREIKGEIRNCMKILKKTIIIAGGLKPLP